MSQALFFGVRKKLGNPDADLSNVHFYALLLSTERNIAENKYVYFSQWRCVYKSSITGKPLEIFILYVHNYLLLNVFYYIYI